MNKLDFFQKTKGLTYKEFRILFCLLNDIPEKEVYKLFNIDSSLEEYSLMLNSKINPFILSDILNETVFSPDTHFNNCEMEIGKTMEECGQEIIDENSDR